MSQTAIDRIIAREVGQLCWDLLPDMHPGLTRNEKDEAFRAIWDPAEPDDLRAVRDADPPAEYPVIYLGIEVMAGLAPQPFLYPPKYGKALRLSEYLNVLRRFLILQFIGTEQSHVHLIWRAVRSLAQKLTQAELLTFVDQLWRGRWIVGAYDWAHMRISVLTGGTESAISKLQADEQRLESEAVRLIGVERALKDSARSMDEWLHEAYCLLPDIITWFFTIRRANKANKSDELEKYDRILDEFLADILTTIQIPCSALRGGESLAGAYAIRPLMQSRTVDGAIKEIRGLYRGRSIIPKVWYESAKRAIETLAPSELTKLSEHRFSFLSKDSGSILPQTTIAQLNNVDLAQLFGQALTAQEKSDHWLLLGTWFDHWENDAE